MLRCTPNYLKSNIYNNIKLNIQNSLNTPELKIGKILRKFTFFHTNSTAVIQEKNCQLQPLLDPPQKVNKRVVPEFETQEDPSATKAKRLLESDSSPIRAHREIQKVLDPKKRIELAIFAAEKFVYSFPDSIEFLRTVKENYLLSNDEIAPIVAMLNDKYTRDTGYILMIHKQNTQLNTWN